MNDRLPVRCCSCASYFYLLPISPIGIVKCPKCSAEMLYLDHPEGVQLRSTLNVPDNMLEEVRGFEESKFDSTYFIELIMQIEEDTFRDEDHA